MEITFKRIPADLIFTAYDNGNTGLVLKGAKGSFYEDERIITASADPGFKYDNIDQIGFNINNHYEDLRDCPIEANIIYEEVEYITPSDSGKIMGHNLTDVGLALRVDQLGFEREEF